MNIECNVTRRSFMKSVGFTTAASSLSGTVSRPAQSAQGSAGKPALLGGTPVHQGPWPSWPQEGPPDDAIMMRALQEKRWCYLRSGAHFCRDYEKQLGSDYGGVHVMLTNAGTTALHACLYAMDIGPGDEVLVTGESFIATMQSILSLFALPIFVDVDPATGLMDADLLEQAVTPRTKAIMPVHLYGAACDMDKVMGVARKHNLKVIEDACQSPYVEWDGHKLGTIGNCGAVSFNVWKTLGCGEGGMIVTTNDKVARFGVSNITVASDTAGLLGYDRLWLDQRGAFIGSLTAQEISDIGAFVATGRRAVLIGENNDWTNWNNQILGIVGGSYSGNDTSDVINTITASPITAGVNSIYTIVDGIAVGGLPLFDQNVATLWGTSQNVLSILSVNIMDDDYIVNNDNVTFSANTAEWLAGTPIPEPGSITLLITGLGLIAGIAWKRGKKE